MGYHDPLESRLDVSFRWSTKVRKLIRVETKRRKDMEVLRTVVDGNTSEKNMSFVRPEIVEVVETSTRGTELFDTSVT